MRYLSVLAFSLVLARSTSGQQAAAPAFQVSGQWKISGTVVDAVNGSPLSRATIVLQLPGKILQTVVAGADGRFLFENVPAGRYIVGARHIGYISEGFEAHHRYSVGVAVGPNIPSPDLVFRVHPEASIFGIITDEHNDPVCKAAVHLIETGVLNGRWYSVIRGYAMTNEEGAYHLPHLPSGKYFIEVEAEPWYAQRRKYFHNADKPIGPLVTAGGASSTGPPDLDVAYPVTFYPGVASIAAASAIELPAGKAFTANIQLHAVSSLYVQVPLPDVDLENASLWIWQTVAGTFGRRVSAVTAQTAAGVAEIGGLVPGRYELKALIGPNRKSGPVRELEISDKGEITVTDPAPTEIVTGRVEIQPPDTSRKSLAVAFRNQETGGHYETLSVSSQGELEMEKGVPAGTYDVLLGGRGYFLQSVSAEGARTVGQTVEIRIGSKPKLTVVATSAISLVGGTALKEGKPFTGAMMVLVPDNPLNNLQLFRRDESNSDGSFNFLSVVPGHYTILALENGWDLDWNDAKAWQPLVAQGIPIQVEAKKTYTQQVKVQKAQ